MEQEFVCLAVNRYLRKQEEVQYEKHHLRALCSFNIYCLKEIPGKDLRSHGGDQDSCREHVFFFFNLFIISLPFVLEDRLFMEGEDALALRSLQTFGFGLLVAGSLQARREG